MSYSSDNASFYGASCFLVGGVPIGHGLLPLHNVACNWFSSISWWLPADQGGVMVDFLHCGLFRSIGHLCNGSKQMWSDHSGFPCTMSVSLWTSGLTEDVSSLGLCRQEGLADAVNVLSHDPDDVLATLNQFRNLTKQTVVWLSSYSCKLTSVETFEN